MKKFFLILAFFLLAFTCVACEDDAAAFDIDAIVFESQEFTEDGQPHYLECQNVPEGVEVIYTGNGAKKVGTYPVVAVFYDVDGNELGRKEATLTIKKGSGSGSGNNNNDNTGNDNTGNENGGNDNTGTTSLVIYFQNNWNWTDLKIYFFGEGDIKNAEFPGVELTTLVGKDGPSPEAQYDIYKIEISADMAYTGFIVSGFDAGKNGGVNNQTPDILFAGLTPGSCFYLEWDAANNCNKVGSYIYTPAA